ncbi:hypothetical protein GCM10023184_42410 [Flaviaesturariibacter amylovorans]|uniref:PKD domain-containing protein n=1 Tax=Flaviaesturariibacter amylovorans TaxID=1084520 RepID=A0ABP8HQH8_9BACT
MPFFLPVLILLATACKKSNSGHIRAPDTRPPRVLKGPVAHAGTDTTLYLPFSTHGLDGTRSSDSDGTWLRYHWRIVSGPAGAYLNTTGLAHVGARRMLVPGNYEFELTVTDEHDLSSSDRVVISVREPVCTGALQERIIPNQVWDLSWGMQLNLYNPFGGLPHGSYVRNVYLRRGGSTSWQRVLHVDAFDGNGATPPLWEYGNYSRTLYIYPDNYQAIDTPDVKIEYCN